MPSRQIKIELLENALRWTNNILVEVVANHGAACTLETQQSLRTLTLALARAHDALRAERITER